MLKNIAMEDDGTVACSDHSLGGSEDEETVVLDSNNGQHDHLQVIFIPTIVSWTNFSIVGRYQG